MNFNKLSLEEKFGQMILIGLDIYDINDEIIELIQKYKIGGVVLYKKNYTSIETMIEVVNKLKKINEINKIPLFISIDQENGRVNRFPKDIARISSAAKQAKTKNMKVINAVNELTTYLLSAVGINMNFAPDLDIVRSDKNKAIGNRSYGTNIEDVIKYGLPFMKQMQKNNIISVVKHFPGHGATNKDSHFVIPKIKDIKALENEDIKVFENAIKEGADAIMVGHLILKGYGLKPATINKKIIDDYITKKYKYKGLLVTDDLRMNTLRYIYGLKRSIQKSIEAGHNVLMIKYKKGDASKLYKKLLEMVKFCEIDPELINESAKKIVTIKKKYKLTNEPINSKLNIELINNKIKKINSVIDKDLGVSI